MNLVRFRLGSAHRKLTWVLATGRYLMQRVDARHGVVSLYYLADGRRGLFAEIGYDARQGRALYRRVFRRPRRLYAYVASLRLPPGG